jgi:hypothetical protein
MKKLLLVITVLTFVATLSVPANAAATLYDFTFRDTAGNPYCDGLFVYNYGVPKTLVDGYHWNAFGCGTGSVNVNGFKGGVATAYQYSGVGSVLIISDPLLASTGVTWLVNTTYKHWTVWESGGGAGEVVVNYGTFVNFTKADHPGTKTALQR